MLIHGITVRLYDKVRTGKDALNHPVYEYIPTDVDNVLIEPMSAQDISDAMDMTGRKAVYRLCLPKGDAHDWTDKRVEFFGKTWHTVGDEQEWIEDMVPLSWNKKVMVELVNG